MSCNGNWWRWHNWYRIYSEGIWDGLRVCMNCATFQEEYHDAGMDMLQTKHRNITKAIAFKKWQDHSEKQNSYYQKQGRIESEAEELLRKWLTQK